MDLKGKAKWDAWNANKGACAVGSKAHHNAGVVAPDAVHDTRL